MKEKLLVQTEAGFPMEVVQVFPGTNRSVDHIPTPETLALAVAGCSTEWKEAFLRKLIESDPQTFTFRAVESAVPEIGDFGCCPEDSKSLLELREAIDSCLGWSSDGAEKQADYVARIHEIANVLTLSADERVEHLEEELRRIDDVLRDFGFEPEVKDAFYRALKRQRDTIARQRAKLRTVGRIAQLCLENNVR